MANAESIQYAEGFRQKVNEFKKVCQGLNEETASSAPGDRWSPKQIISHLLGPEGIGMFPSIKAFLDQDTPRLDMEAENPFFTEARKRMPFGELFAEFEKEYGRIADLVAGLSAEQLKRKARIPMLKETPIGEYPTLKDWIAALGDYHLDFHLDHLKEILQALEVTAGK